MVEDDADIRLFYEELLTLEGYPVVFAQDGHTAMERALDTVVAGIILDYRLPDVQGLDLCQWLRATLGAEMTILLVTAEHQPGLEARSFMAGATAYLRKPFAPDGLLTLLAAYVPL